MVMRNETRSTRTRDRDELAARQWAEWRLTRRHLLRSGSLAGGALALGGFGAAPRSLLHTAAAQEQPKPGGKLVVRGFLEDLGEGFDPVNNSQAQSWWNCSHVY